MRMGTSAYVTPRTVVTVVPSRTASRRGASWSSSSPIFSRLMARSASTLGGQLGATSSSWEGLIVRMRMPSTRAKCVCSDCHRLGSTSSRRPRRGVGLSLSLTLGLGGTKDAELSNLLIQGGPMDAEPTSGLRAVPPNLFQGLENQFPFRNLERVFQGRVGGVRRGGVTVQRRLAVLRLRAWEISRRPD